MIYITGDIHGNIDRIQSFCRTHKTNINDILVILGDVGFNYYLDKRDSLLKHRASKLPITLFCIRGNHEERPENIDTYHKGLFCGGVVYEESSYPNLKFSMDGVSYWLDGSKCLVLGGAYSIDKFFRLAHGMRWFSQEQLSHKEMFSIEKSLDCTNKEFSYIFSHTCPYSVRPTHLFLPDIDQSQVDTNMEIWLESISKNISFDRWYFGHYHGNWTKQKYTMLYDKIIPLGRFI